ncbi:hypothetical protein AAHA92_23380 [Salvia divinorum]|uniref:Uncharacterized protein n=1 Tax=Salvia divinorum TaxID=28513 RepID=A0ABD1GUW8_SALDI
MEGGGGGGGGGVVVLGWNDEVSLLKEDCNTVNLSWLWGYHRVEDVGNGAFWNLVRRTELVNIVCFLLMEQQNTL